MLKNNFDNCIFTILNESIIDIPRNSLDPAVFEFQDGQFPILHPAIKVQIEQDVARIDDAIRVKRFYIIGSILTNRYNAVTDIDVNVEVSAQDKKDYEIEDAFAILNKLNGRLATGTTHPINYYLMTKPYDLNKTDAAYDVQNETWIKEPDYKGDEPQSYVDRFSSTIEGIDLITAELRRDIIDFEELKALNPKQITGIEKIIDRKLLEIEENIDLLLSNYHNVKGLRKQAFEREMTPEEIREYASKNKLPENVIYKMMERYYYLEFLKKLEAAFSQKDIEKKDINKLKTMGKGLWG